jgi:hypothetical protein
VRAVKIRESLMLVLDNLAEAPSQQSEHFACRTDPANVTGMAFATLGCIPNVPLSLGEEMYAAFHSAANIREC